MWHWLAFLPRVPQHDLGADGHPRPGSFMPPVGLPRRMFAGGNLRVDRPLAVGALLERRSTVTAVERKSGRTGELCFVTVRHSLSDEAGGAVEETQEIVYLEAAQAASSAASPADSSAASPATSPAGGHSGAPGEQTPLADVADDWPLRLRIEMTPTLLFRFSALTYNAHRIHYDRDWATGVEGYEGIVVHGPLQAIALGELCRRRPARLELSGFSFRARRAAFAGGEMSFLGHRDGGSVALRAVDATGRTTMEAEATLRRDEAR
jgi:3-methylfumaryl-CoA hydratase